MGAACGKKIFNQKNSHSVKEPNLNPQGTLEKDNQNEKPNLHSNDRINDLDVHEPKTVISQYIPNPSTIQEHLLFTTSEKNFVDSVYGFEDVSKSNSIRFSGQKGQESNKDQNKSTFKLENMQKFESIVEKRETFIPADKKIDYNKEEFGSSVQPSIPLERNQDSIKHNIVFSKNTADFTNLENTTELSKSNNQNIAFSEPPVIPVERNKMSRISHVAHAHLMNPWENLGDAGDSDYASPTFEQIEAKKYEERKDKIIYDKLRESDYYTPVGLENPEKELKFSKKNEIPLDPKERINHFSKYPLEESNEIEEYVNNSAFIQKSYNQDQENHNNKDLRLSDISSSNPKKIEKISSLKTNKREELNFENEQHNMMHDNQAILPIPEEDHHTQKEQSQSHSSSLLSILDEKDDNNNLNYLYNNENSGSHLTVEKESDCSSLSEDNESENHQINLVKTFSYNLKKKEPALPLQRILFENQHEEEGVKIENIEGPKVDEEEKQEPLKKLNSQKKNEEEEQKIEVFEKNERIEKNEFGEKIEKTEKIEKNEKIEKFEIKKKPPSKKKFKSENCGFRNGAWLEDREETIDENGVNCIEMFGTFIPKKRK